MQLQGSISQLVFRMFIGCLGVVCSSCAGAQQGVKADFRVFVSSTLTPATFVTPAVTAAGSQFIFKPAGFGSGAEGYGYHYGVSLADTVGGKFFRKFVFPAVSGHPDRYQPTHGKRVLTRLLNVAGHGIFVDPQQSTRIMNWSGVPASMVSAALSNAYQPPRPADLVCNLSESWHKQCRLCAW